MRPFDIYMDGWCRERGIAYTRYCDDMTFSGDFDAAALCSKVRSYLEAMGFTLNEKKTKLLTGDVRQSVTGIVVNDKLQVSREYRKKLRQEVYYCKNTELTRILREWRRTRESVGRKSVISVPCREGFVLCCR